MPRDECGSVHEEKKRDEEEKKRTTSTLPRRPRASADRTELKPALRIALYQRIPHCPLLSQTILLLLYRTASPSLSSSSSSSTHSSPSSLQSRIPPIRWPVRHLVGEADARDTHGTRAEVATRWQDEGVVRRKGIDIRRKTQS
ncbi:uncharacterized protein LOC116844525 [Odontomachus brunneus]|uniref:uncharacterized protein LOC116844525 n=1 Tax=Odontomachus brunneus TaxID=486640 RepID=UPI0013F283EF|nr:uncharacterized protein LOC116844525 [Odontomachus brunneus]